MRDDPSEQKWEALARYLTGESPAEEVDSIRDEIEVDPDRRALLQALGRAMTQLSARPPQDVDVDAAWAKVSARMRDSPVIALDRRRSRARSGGRAVGLRIAAAIALLLGGFYFYSRLTVDQAAVEAIGPLSLRTGTGQIDSRRLPDGSRIVLGPGSEVLVAEGFGTGAREVNVRGQVLFEVVHDASAPFLVRAGGAVIRDRGTVFSVYEHPDGAIDVAVTEGSVSLTGSTGAGSETVLGTGDRGRVAARGEVSVERGAATDADMAFATGSLVLVEAAMPRIAADIERWYGIRVIVDPTLADRHVTSTFAGESVDEVLDIVALTMSARVERRGDTAWIRVDGGM